MAYIGNSPENIQRGRRAIYEFTSTAGQTVYTGLDDNNQTLDLLEANEQSVFLNGIRLVPTDDYTVSGDTLTLTSAASLNDHMIIETQTEVGNAVTYTRAESDARYINYDGDIVAGDLQISGEVDAGSLIVDTDVLVVDATNNRVGVGTTSPGNLLHVNSTVNNGAVITLESTAVDSYPFLRLKNDAREYQVTNHGPLGDKFTVYDGTAGAHRFTIDTSGNVGIGTDNPGYKLEVSGTAHVTNTLSADSISIPTKGLIFNQAFGSGVPTITMTGTANNGRGGAINFKESDGAGGAITNTAAIYSTDGGTGNSNYGGLTIAAYQSDIRFSTGTLAGTKMIVQAGGNVGIGTTSPGAKLHVNGASTRIQVSDSGTSFTAQDFLSNSNAVRATIGVERSSGGGLFVGSSAYAAVFGTASNGDTQFATNNNIRMTINSSGNVGIGNTNPQRQVHIGAADNSNHDAVIVLNNGGATGNRAGIEWRYEGITAPRARLSINASTLELEADINGTKVAAFDGDGLKMTAGKGIKFSGYGSNNILDDYEEGTWTPLFGDNSTTASNGGQFSATYVKIGKLVTVSVDITTLTYSGANLNYMYGLPFAGGVSGVGNGGGGVGYTTTTNIVPGIHVTSNTSAIYFMNLGTNVGGETLSISGKRFIFSLTYETS